jgi:hypothetical protein
MVTSMRILVTGSRDWPDRDVVREALVDAIGGTHPVTLVVGDCPTGADRAATDVWRYWASVHPDWYLPAEVYRADWRTEGKVAGPNRNQRMVDAGVDVCLAFPLDGSRGTWDCVRRARAAGIPVRLVGHDGWTAA